LSKIVLILFVSLSISTLAQQIETGKASYYADKFQGKKTASGQLYHPDSLTAAHKTIAFGTFVKVTNLKNDKSVIVRINDRGPFVKGRIIDLSRKAMQYLNGIHSGLIHVKVEVLMRE
jgi:rare lipoprotein A